MGNSLEKYIIDQRKKGFSDNLIKEKLISRDYPKKYVENFFLRLKLKKILIIFLGLFIISSVIFFTVFQKKSFYNIKVNESFSKTNKISILGFYPFFVNNFIIEVEKTTNFNQLVNMYPDGFGGKNEFLSVIKTDYLNATSNFGLIIFSPDSMYDLKELDYLANLEEYDSELNLEKEDLFPVFFKNLVNDKNQLLALPLNSDVYVLFCRDDLFNDKDLKLNFQNKYGYDLEPPKDWDSYLDVSEFMTKQEGDNITLYGTTELMFEGTRYEFFLIRFSSYGGKLLNENNELNLNTNAGIKALKNMRQTLKNSPRTTISENLSNPYLEKKSAMIIAPANYFSKILSENQELIKITSVSSLPKSMAIYTLIGIPKKFEGKQDSIEIISTMFSKEKILDQVNSNAFITPFRKSSLAQLSKEIKYLPENKIENYVDVLEESYLNSVEYELFKDSNELRIILDNAIGEYLSDETVSEEETLKKVSDEWNYKFKN